MILTPEKFERQYERQGLNPVVSYRQLYRKHSQLSEKKCHCSIFRRCERCQELKKLEQTLEKIVTATFASDHGTYTY